MDRKVFKDRLLKVANTEKQKRIAQELGVTEATVSKWFSEQYNVTPDADHLLTISSAYGCSIDYILGNDISGKIRQENVTTKTACMYLRLLLENFLADFATFEESKIGVAFSRMDMKQAQQIATLPVETRKKIVASEIIAEFIEKYKHLNAIRDQFSKKEFLNMVEGLYDGIENQLLTDLINLNPEIITGFFPDVDKELELLRQESNNQETDTSTKKRRGR